MRVEFQGDEVYWALTDSYTFDMLQQDAARYWDLSTVDAVLYDEHGAIWPSDAYVALELAQHPTDSRTHSPRARLSLPAQPTQPTRGGGLTARRALADTPPPRSRCA